LFVEERTFATVSSTDHGSDLFRRTDVRKSTKINLASAIAAVVEQPVREITFSELVESYNAVKLDGSAQRMSKWVTAFGDECAWGLTSEKLELAAQAMVDHGYAPATANRDLSNIGSIFKWAKESRLSPRGFKSPTRGIKRFSEPIRRIHLDKEHLDRIKARSVVFRDRRFGVFVHLLMDTGARKSELLRRKWSEVDLDKGEILAPTTKSGHPRVLFFTPQTKQLLMRVFPKRSQDALIFEGRVPHQPVNYRAAWKRMISEVGLQNVRQHDMRHVAAANLLKAGVTLGVAAQVLGHDPAVLARRYGHLETSTLRQAQEASWKQN
jgi:integrase